MEPIQYWNTQISCTSESEISLWLLEKHQGCRDLGLIGDAVEGNICATGSHCGPSKPLVSCGMCTWPPQTTKIQAVGRGFGWHTVASPWWCYHFKLIPRTHIGVSGFQLTSKTLSFLYQCQLYLANTAKYKCSSEGFGWRHPPVAPPRSSSIATHKNVQCCCMAVLLHVLPPHRFKCIRHDVLCGHQEWFQSNHQVWSTQFLALSHFR